MLGRTLVGLLRGRGLLGVTLSAGVICASGLTLLGGGGCIASADRSVDGDGGVVGDGGGIVADDGAVAAGKSYFYVHTETTLYQIDPTDKKLALKKLGDVDCVLSPPANGDHSLTDIAVSRDGRVFAVSSNFAYSLDLQASGVKCKKTWPLTGASGTGADHPVFYGLTFAPIGTLSPTDEVLVAANSDGELFTIDETNGKTTAVGNFGVDPKTKLNWSLSGDIVFLENGGSPVGFATVRTCPAGGGACSGVDTLIELNVNAIKPGAKSTLKSVRGLLNKATTCKSGNNSFDKMFGIVAYEDKVYGFSDDGFIVEISNKDGSSCLITANAGMRFKGAGIATTAPVIAVPN